MQLLRDALPALVDAVVFDCDGLLLDTEQAWARAEAAVLAEHGIGIRRRDRAALVGLTLPDVVATLAARIRTADLDGVRAALLTQLQTDPAPPRSLPGAVELVRAVAARVPVGVASNSSRAALDAALAAGGLAHLLGVTVSADDVAAPKPDPAPYLLAFDRLGARPDRTVAFEDSRTGVAAARAAGAFVVAVPSVGGVALEADLTVRSLADRRIRRWGCSLRRASSARAEPEPSPAGS